MNASSCSVIENGLVLGETQIEGRHVMGPSLGGSCLGVIAARGQLAHSLAGVRLPISDLVVTRDMDKYLLHGQCQLFCLLFASCTL